MDCDDPGSDTTNSDTTNSDTTNSDTTNSDTTNSDTTETTHTAWDDLVAYDIETTGLDRKIDKLTVVCLFGHGCGEGITLNFLRKETFKEKRLELITLLDQAPRLASFNGIRFDAPFIQIALNVDPGTVQRWIMKSFDVWEICKTLLRTTFKMELLLKENGFECKSGSGIQAVEWAKDESKWPDLERYCLKDAKLTWQVSRLPVIKIPQNNTYFQDTTIHLVKTSDKTFEFKFT